MMETEAVRKEAFQQLNDEEGEGPPPGWESAVLPPPSPPPSSSAAAAVTEMAQMVCGSCRRLLSYPHEAKYVNCSCCQTVNLVLEAHQVGQVNCDNCKVLLMYPYGAPAVRCSSCNSLTDIRENNERPPWSVQQGQPKVFNTVQ